MAGLQSLFQNFKAEVNQLNQNHVERWTDGWEEQTIIINP